MAFTQQTSDSDAKMSKMGRERTSDPNNPYGVGDPNDMTLRKVEKDIMIPMKMRDKAKAEKCTAVVQAFSECCKLSSVAMVVKCRDENAKLKACLTTWYNDEGFRKQCTEEYLIERADYRRTGVRKKDMKKYLG